MKIGQNCAIVLDDNARANATFFVDVFVFWISDVGLDVNDSTLDRRGSFCALRWKLFVLQGVHDSAINVTLGEAFGQRVELEEHAHGKHA